MSELFSACARGLDELKKYHNDGHDVNDKDEYGETALHHCSEYGAIDSVKYLIANGADINILDEYGNTPIIKAVAAAQHFKVVGILLDAGANPNIKNEFGDTALSEAQMREKNDTAKLLIKNGAT